MTAPWRVHPLLEHVVAGGYCIGCGACAAVADSPLTMRLDADGLYRPECDPGHVEPADGADLGAVCPFYSTTDEDALAAEHYATPDTARDPRLGFFRALHAGAVTDAGQRAQSSSGGIVTWLLLRLLERGDIDGVVHVGATRDDAEGALFRYQVSTDAAAVRAAAKSRYHPVEISRVSAWLREHPGRYAFVGVPCFVKAMRLLAHHDDDVDRAIVCCIALFCGHMKSTEYARHLAWQVGIPPDGLDGIDFRAKRPERPANRYGIVATGRVAGAAVERTAPMDRLHGSDWGLGLFKPSACDYCDDIAGETADLAAGDAWLPQYVHDPRGTSVVIVRTALLQQVLADGAAAGELALDAIDADAVARSQDASYRHRRDGLALRLAQCDDAGRWRPVKRVPAARAHLSARQRRVFRLRQRLAAASHPAFAAARAAGRHGVFRRRLAPLILRYYGASRGYLRTAVRALLLRLPPRWRVRLPGGRRL